MASNSIAIRVTKNAIPAILRALQTGAMTGVEGTCLAVQATASATGHRITGAMDASVYVIGPQGSDYAARTADAESRRPAVPVLPPVSVSAQQAIAGVVAVAEPYAVMEEARPGHSWFFPSVAAEAGGHGPRVGKTIGDAVRTAAH